MAGRSTTPLSSSSQPYPQISIRPATILDIPTLAQIATTALSSNEVFSYIYRYKHLYPDSHVYFYQHYLRRILLEKGMRVLVAEVDVSDDKYAESEKAKRTLVDGGRESSDSESLLLAEHNSRGGGKEIVGFASWSFSDGCTEGKRREGGWKKRWKERVGRWVLSIVVNSEERVVRWLHGERRDEDRERRRKYTLRNWVVHRSLYTPRPLYELDTLATSPTSQNCGVGRALIRWAQERAEKDGASITAESGASVVGFYERMGFRKVGEFTIGTIKGVHVEGWGEGGCPVVRWDPPGKRE